LIHITSSFIQKSRTTDRIAAVSITSTKNINIIKLITLWRHYVRDIFVRRYYW